MLVSTPTCGRIMRSKGASSPGWFVPASKIPTRSVPAPAIRLNGTPTSLLKLAALHQIGPAVPSTRASNSFVVVFPFDPATATTVAPSSPRYAAAILPNAARVSSVLNTATSPGTLPPKPIDTTTPATPRRATSST
jgi:hypothetical protein